MKMLILTTLLLLAGCAGAPPAQITVPGAVAFCQAHPDHAWCQGGGDE
jgi:hypothetical protein